MVILDRWLALSERLARWAVWFGGALIIASAFLVAGDVILRKLFAWSLGGADELSGYAFAIGTAWALSFTLIQRANVRVDALYAKLASPLRALLDLLALAALGLFVGLLGWQALAVLETSVSFDARATTPLQTPLWMPQSLWVAGLALFVFTWIPLALRCVIALVAGDLQTVRRLAGARTIEEDAAAESSHLERQAPGPRG